MDERIRIELTGWAHGGEALGRHAGKIVFVPHAMPGEQAIVEIVEEKARWARGRLVDILVPSPYRVSPPCPYFGICQGCQWQYVAYQVQLDAKREIVQDQMARLGHRSDAVVREVIGMETPWQYRNMAQLYPAPDGRLGIKAGQSEEAVAIDACLLFHPLLAELFDALELDVEDLHRISLRAGTRTEDLLIIFETVGDWAPELEADLPLSCVLRPRDDDLRVLAGDEWLWEEVGSRQFRISALSPFPVNTQMAERMIDGIRNYLLFRPDDLLLDAGSGVGLFGLSFVNEVSGVIAIEENAWAVSDFVANAGGAAAGVIQGSLAEGMAQIEDTVHLAVVSAPRSGLGDAAIRELRRLAPRQMAYIASDPAILARDVKQLSWAGYHLVEIQPFDMMPQTRHIHLVALWERD